MGNISFLQSSEWAKFQESLGRKVWLLKDDFGQILVIKQGLPFNKSYLYSPRTNIRHWLSNDGLASFRKSLEKIKEIAKKEGAIFFKIEPEIENDLKIREFLESFGFRKSQKEIQPRKTLILDITKSEEEILKGMHQKTRYNIRIAKRNGIEVKSFNFPSQNHFEIFWKLLKQTSKRDKFSPYSKEYYQKMLDLSFSELFLAKYKNKIIAANVLVFFERRATYLHGASDYNFRNLMASYLLHWEQIKEAKRRGFKEYDFWGINEKKWPGLTRFKKGFGGKEINYLGSYDLIFQPFWYKLYNFRRMFRS